MKINHLLVLGLDIEFFIIKQYLSWWMITWSKDSFRRWGLVGMLQPISAAASFTECGRKCLIAETERQVHRAVGSALLVSLSSGHGPSIWNAHPFLLNCPCVLFPSECKVWEGSRGWDGPSMPAGHSNISHPHPRLGKSSQVSQLRGSNRHLKCHFT